MGCCKLRCCLKLLEWLWKSSNNHSSPKTRTSNVTPVISSSSSSSQAKTFEVVDGNSTKVGRNGVMKEANHSSVSKMKVNMSYIFYRGVSIKVLKELRKEWNQIKGEKVKKRSNSGIERNASNGEKVVDLIVKKKCADLNSSYVELLDNQNSYKDDIGECNVFISHAWQYDFGDLICAIEDFERDHSNKEKFYYFLDFIAVNQFKPDSDLKNLQNLVSRCEYFLLVLLPWKNPLPLSRMWCIYEIATALDYKKRPIVSMPKEQEDLLKEELMKGKQADAIIEVFKKLDSKNAKASLEKDKKMIAEFIDSKLGGFEKVDQKVGAYLCSWIMGKLLKINQDWPKANISSKDRANFLSLAGSFLDSQGEHQKAVDMYRECVELRTAFEGDKSDPVLKAKNKLAVAYDHLGKHKRARDIRKEFVMVKEAKCGPNNLSTMEMKDSLAVSYDQKLRKTGMIKEAIDSGVSEMKGNMADIFHRGVSIIVLRDLKKEWNQIKGVELRKPRINGNERNASNGEKVVDLIVKKKCADLKSSYVELLYTQNSNEDAIGECNVFISHAWQYDFGDLMAAIEDFETDNSNKEKFYYFLDYIAVNQFEPDSDLKNLQNLVSRCEYFLLVLLPWWNPLPLSRMWCIYEIATALDYKKRPIVSMPKEQEDLLKEELMKGKHADAIIEVFKKLDSKNAKASFDKDKKMIAEFIDSKLGGFEKVDQKVGACLRSWVMIKLLKINQDWPKANMTSIHRGNFLILAGCFLDFQGEHQKAVDMYHECVKLRTASEGDKSDAVLIAKNNLAVAYDHLGWHKKAIDIRKELVMVKEAVCGLNHPSTLEVKDSLAVSYDHMNKPTKALALKRQVLQIRERLHGKEDSSVLLSKNNIAYSLRNLGRHKEVLNLNKEIYDIRHKNLGEWDPDTLLAASNLATSYARLGQHKNAVEKHKEAYRGYSKIRGIDSEYTFDSLSGLIRSFRHLGEFEKAKKFAEEGLASASKCFRDDHYRTKEFAEAIKYFSQMPKADRAQRLVPKIKAEAQIADSVTVKAILSYKKKVLGNRPEQRVNVPPGGMEVTEYLKLCDPNIDGNMQHYWVANKKNQKLERIPYQAVTVWVKSMLICNIIQTYLPKVRGKWPTVDVCLPKEGITKKDLIRKIDKNLDAQLYRIENRRSQSLAVVMPGASLLWMKRVRRNVKRRSDKLGI